MCTGYQGRWLKSASSQPLFAQVNQIALVLRWKRSPNITDRRKRGKARDPDKLVKHLRFVAFHSDIGGHDADGGGREDFRVNNAKCLQHICKKLERRVEGLKPMVAGETK
jgi:hypothetical protein